MNSYQDVINFWFKECAPAQWFKKDDAFDAKLRERFFDTYQTVVRGETAGWRATPQGRLAEVIVLDQFARNMFRNTPQAFEQDPLALSLAQEAREAGDDKRLSLLERRFLYMPFMHSESKEVHKQAMWLFFFLWNPGVLYYEYAHKKIIDRFGRYPHRNAILGRASTPDELEFVKTHPGF
jgi:uncharacterized protein (DUF924 family)